MKHPDLRHIDHFIQREARNLKPTAVIVWAFLFTRANPKLIVSPWVDLISLKTNCSKNRVKIALAQLERDGYLEQIGDGRARLKPRPRNRKERSGT